MFEEIFSGAFWIFVQFLYLPTVLHESYLNRQKETLLEIPIGTQPSPPNKNHFVTLNMLVNLYESYITHMCSVSTLGFLYPDS